MVFVSPILYLLSEMPSARHLRVEHVVSAHWMRTSLECSPVSREPYIFAEALGATTADGDQVMLVFELLTLCLGSLHFPQTAWQELLSNRHTQRVLLEHDAIG